MIDNTLRIHPLISIKVKYLDIQQRFEEILQNQYAPNTNQSYLSDIRHFQEWCKQNNVQELSFEMFLAYLSDISLDMKIATIKRRVVSLKHFYDKLEIPVPEKLLQQFLKGLQRTKVQEGERVKMASALQYETLKTIITNIDVTNIKGKRDKAFLLLAYTGAFRISELVGLNVDDLQFDNKGCTVFVGKSKTDQNGKGMYKAIPYLFNDYCPVESLQSYLSNAGIEEGAIFRTVKGRKSNVETTENRLDRRNANRMLNNLSKEFSMHSLRSGFITDCKEKGIADGAIMNQTGHKSISMIQHYARHKTVWKGNAVNELFGTIK